MAISLREIACVSCSGAGGLDKKRALAGRPPSTLDFFSSSGDKNGKLVALREPGSFSVQAGSTGVPRTMRWWEKGAAPNMMEIGSARELAESLLAAGDKLVVVDFYSPGCGGCRALHPKICQIAEANRDVVFLKVNYEEHKSMCQSLQVHVLPFFRFYRGADGRVCSFSCTNATINKFRDALAKHGAERDGGAAIPGPAKGLEESELLKLASNRDFLFGPPPGGSSGSLPGATEIGEGYGALTTL
ncbi:unnamed protein product [Spirodela intermedia]|uniref:Thioredoxin domain-containing protein n=1 Tax=Spirodela intermedia TaxID=51605 RepID=A0A7I8J570_SPIIN|nr:unnamed protein product [Spirodela intermedia]CAA6664531.1 unnamed protein product [Spirodela intermedia]